MKSKWTKKDKKIRKGTLKKNVKKIVKAKKAARREPAPIDVEPFAPTLDGASMLPDPADMADTAMEPTADVEVLA